MSAIKVSTDFYVCDTLDDLIIGDLNEGTIAEVRDLDPNIRGKIYQSVDGEWVFLYNSTSAPRNLPADKFQFIKDEDGSNIPMIVSSVEPVFPPGTKGIWIPIP